MCSSRLQIGGGRWTLGYSCMALLQRRANRNPQRERSVLPIVFSIAVGCRAHVASMVKIVQVMDFRSMWTMKDSPAAVACQQWRAWGRASGGLPGMDLAVLSTEVYGMAAVTLDTL